MSSNEIDIEILHLLAEHTKALQRLLEAVDNLMGNCGEDIEKALRFYVDKHRHEAGQPEENLKMMKTLLLWKTFVGGIVKDEAFSLFTRPDYEGLIEELEKVLGNR